MRRRRETTQQTAALAQATSGFGENLAPDAGGKVILVEMMTDEQGNNRFERSGFEAHQGDVVRFTLKTGLHNVNSSPI